MSFGALRKKNEMSANRTAVDLTRRTFTRSEGQGRDLWGVSQCDIRRSLWNTENSGKETVSFVK